MRNLKKTSLTSKIIAVVLTVSMIASMSAIFAFSKYRNAHAEESTPPVANDDIGQATSDEQSLVLENSVNSEESVRGESNQNTDNFSKSEISQSEVNNANSCQHSLLNVNDENSLNVTENSTKNGVVPIWYYFEDLGNDTYSLHLSGTEKDNYNKSSEYWYDEEEEEEGGIAWSIGLEEITEKFQNNTVNVTIDNSITPNNTTMLFLNGHNLKSITGLNNLDTSKVTDMWEMFYDCESLTNIDVSGFDTSNVTGMGSLFTSCSSLTNIDVSNWNTSKVTSMDLIFSGCTKLTTIDISSFSSEGIVEAASESSSNISSMFAGCSELTTIYASDKFDVSSLLENENFNQENIFYGCEKLVGGVGTKYMSSAYKKVCDEYDPDDCWYVGNDGKYACIDSTSSNAAGYFTAKESTYTVTLDANGGSIEGATSVTGVASGSAMPELASNQIPTRSGYTFNGYWDNATEGSGTQYYTTAGKSAKNWDKTANATLYAHWTQNSDPIPTPDPVNPDGSTASISSASISSATSTGDSVPVVGLLMVGVVGLALSAFAHCRYRKFSK